MHGTARLGAFILAALLILSAAVFLVGNRRFLFSATYQLGAPFDNVAGLDEGAPVRAGGVRIGTVQHILLPGQPQDKITVLMQLENSTRNVLRKDSVASIETEGLLGKKYVSIGFGSPEAEQLRDGDTIQSRAAFDYGELARKAEEMIDTATGVIGSVKAGVGNINDASGNLKSITAKVDSGQGTVGALVNDPAVYRHLQAALGQVKAGFSSFQDDMDAIKHNPFLKNYFESRGYFDSSELSRHAIRSLPRVAPGRAFTFDGQELFEAGTAKLRSGTPLDQVGAFLESAPFGFAVVETQTGATGAKDENLKLSQGRAVVVRQYLVRKFKIDDSRIRTLGLGESRQASPDSSGSVRVFVYPGTRGQRPIEVRNR